jgi:hypothetical protein
MIACKFFLYIKNPNDLSFLRPVGTHVPAAWMDHDFDSHSRTIGTQDSRDCLGAESTKLVAQENDRFSRHLRTTYLQPPSFTVKGVRRGSGACMARRGSGRSTSVAFPEP